MLVGSITAPVGLFWYGWTVQKGVHWIVPIIATVPVGFGFMIILVHPSHPHPTPFLSVAE